MLGNKKRITIELKEKENFQSENMSNPINGNNYAENLANMITTILDKELPKLKNNSLLHDLVLYSLLEKMKTVQTIENVLSYIKERNVKSVEDVSFRKGEIRIKCST